MTVLILRSRRRPGPADRADDYTQTFSTRYAEKVLGNLVGEDDFCTACGAACTACRRPYARRLAAGIAGVVDLPDALPYLLERPERYVPDDIPPHDVLLALHVHEQVLLEFLRRCGRWGTRAAVVPIESPGWVSGSARQQGREICQPAGVELAFPRPFCAFDPPEGTALATFRREFHVGKPDVELTVRGGIIERAFVHVSAACGATYYVAHHLQGRRVDDDLKYQVVSKRLHSYPCTASMAWDEELGETPLHVAGDAHYEILAPLAGRAAERPPAMVPSPLGRMVQAPVDARESLDLIERAKRAILAELDDRDAVSLADLQRDTAIPPAALSTAAVLLTQQGRARLDAGCLRRA